MIKFKKQNTSFEVKYRSYIAFVVALLFALILLVLALDSLSKLDFLHSILSLVFSGISIYASNLFYEGFDLILDVKNKCKVVTWGTFIKRKQIEAHEFEFKDLEGFTIETMPNVRRIKIVTSKEKILLTQAFDNIGKLEEVAYEIQTWAAEHGHEIKINEESVTFKD